MQAQLEEINRYLPLGDEIEAFWLAAGNRSNDTWLQHRDINEVMLATRLVPAGYLDLGPVE